MLNLQAVVRRLFLPNYFLTDLEGRKLVSKLSFSRVIWLLEM